MSPRKRIPLRESATATVVEADTAPYGDVPYADPGYQSDKKKRYPIDTKAHVKAAWSYINQESNAAKYSAANLKKVKAKIMSAAKKFGVTISEADVPPVDEVKILEQLEGSWEDITNDIRDAVRAAHPGYWIYVRGTFDDTIVYDAEPQNLTAGQATVTYQRTWAIDDNDNLTLGDPTEVEVVDTVQPVTSSESDRPKPRVTGNPEELTATEFIELTERALRADGSITLKVIQPGWGVSGYYSDKLLRRDGPEVFAEGTKMYWDHPSRSEERDRPERSLRDLAAVLTSDARFLEEGPAGPGLYADAKVVGGYRESLAELAPHIGVSIRAMGKGRSGEAEGKKGRIIEKIVPGGHSIDFVTTPGAGGKVLELFEAARPPESTEEDASMDELTEARGRITQLEESVGQITTERDTAVREREAAVERAERAETALNIRRARDVIREALARTRLPEAVRTRLIERLSAEPPLVADGEHAGELDKAALVTKVTEAAQEELKYLSEATGSSRIRGMGSDEADQGDPAKLEEAEKAFSEELGRMGLSETAAKVATAGRG